MKIYIDHECRCHTEYKDGYTEINDRFFDGMCKEAIEKHVYIPHGWCAQLPDGYIQNGFYVAPLCDYHTVWDYNSIAKRAEEESMAELAALIEEIYEEDLEMIG